MRGTIPVFAPDGQKVGYADADQAAELLSDPANIRRGTRRTLRAVQLGGPVPEHIQLAPAGGHSSHGMPTRADSWTNPQGVYSFGYIPRHLRPNFERVLSGLLKAA